MTTARLYSARDLKSQVDFRALVSQYVTLRRVGSQYVGRCPFHSERNPSFYVHPIKKIFYCFGCGQGGDVFDFVRRICNCSFCDALDAVARFSAGVARESEPRSGERFRAGLGASPQAAKRPASYSQSSQERHAEIIAALDATNRRLQLIQDSNLKDSAALATACEPSRSEGSFT